MPRARKYQLSQSLTYHVYNRSNSKQVIFRSDEDREYFCKILRKYIALFSLKIYHWVIMPTHFHLLLEIFEPERLSKAIAGISLAYTQYFHKRYGGCGYLWQGRFKSQPVQKENYLISCGRYIDVNPVKGKIVAAAAEYAYSSARYYCLGIDDGITVTDPMYEEIGTEKEQRQRKYSDFLMDYSDVDGQRWENMDVPQGDKAFIRRLVRKDGRFVSRRRGGIKSAKEVVNL
ncbi:MAG: transposase [Candidatus Omnitrophota bacterium]